MLKRRILSVFALALIAVTALPSAFGAGSTSQPHPQVAEQLKDFKYKVLDLRREADHLNSFSRNPQLSWKSHADRQNRAKEHINQLGRMLTELENQKSLASETQRLAIEQSRPHLEAAAQSLTRAMEMMNEQRQIIHHEGYIDTVRGLWMHSDSLSQKLDTILDYENSKLRFENLEL